jgi:mono/diheme cytochrome c family protein
MTALPRVTPVAAAFAIVGVLLALFVYAGVYDFGADAPHSKPVAWLIAAIRDRSIAVRAGAITAPRDLNDPVRITRGAALYAEMCSECHLAPGMAKTEISQGLYPVAPELSRAPSRPPQEQFWIIKHGVKLTAMAAWGRTHSDDLIWDLVAFAQKLPSLSPEQYRTLAKRAPADHEAMMRNAERH